MSDQVMGNEKWQRVFDTIVADPERRTSFSTALKSVASLADVFRPQFAQSGEFFDEDHDRLVLDSLDARVGLLMRMFRQAVADMMDAGPRLNSLIVTFVYFGTTGLPTAVEVRGRIDGGVIAFTIPILQPRPATATQYPAAETA